MGKNSITAVLASILLTIFISIASAQSPSPGLTRVVGGKTAAAGAWPSQVKIYAPDPAGRGRLRSHCGGTVVGSVWVLTAAHCFVTPIAGGGRRQSVQANDVAIVAGVARLPAAIAAGDPVAAQALKAKRVVYHPEFDPKTFANDVALVELDRAAETPVMALAGPEERGRDLGGLAATIVGWGLTEESGSLDASLLPADLQEAELPVVDMAACKAAYADSALKGNAIDDRSLCAGFRSGARDACSGDSGGPLMLRAEGGGWMQAGVVSWGEGCGRRERFGVYTRVAAFDPWIRQVTRGDMAPPARPSEAFRLSPEELVVAGAGGGAAADGASPRALFALTTPTDVAREASVVEPGDRALVIGVDGYPAPLTLQGSANDAAAIAALLVDTLGFRREQVMTLTDERATRANILAAMDVWLAQGSRPGSRVVLYYSGQGFQSRVFPKLRQGRPGVAIAPVDLELVTDADGRVADVRNPITPTEIARLLSRLSDRATTAIFDATQMSRRELQRPSRVRDGEEGAIRSVEAVVDLAPSAREIVWTRPGEPGVEAGSEAVMWFAASPDQWALADRRQAEPMGVFTQRYVNAIRALRLVAGGAGGGRLDDLRETIRTGAERFCEEAGGLCRAGVTPQLATPDGALNVAALAFGRPAGSVARGAPTIQNPAQLELALGGGAPEIARVTSRKPGYLILVDIGRDGRLRQVYPDVGAIETARRPATTLANMVAAGETLEAPLPGGAEAGGLLVAILSDKPLQALDLPDRPGESSDASGALVFVHDFVRTLRAPNLAKGGIEEVEWSFSARAYGDRR